MVCTGGLATLIPTILKENLKGAYKSRFGDDLESYIFKLFLDAHLEVLSEKNIQEIYRKHGLNGKVCDFMFGNELNIIFESKAIEPGEIVLSTTDRSLLKRSLPASLIKSIKQGQETAHNLKKTEDYKNAKFALVVITHEDFWFATGEDIVEFVDHELAIETQNLYNYIPIQFKDIIFLTINTFESLLEAHKEKIADLENTISKCIEVVNTPKGRRYTMAHVVQDVLEGKIKGHKFVSDEADKWISKLPITMKSNAEFWGTNAEALMIAHQKMMMSIDEAFENKLQAPV